MKFRIIEKDGKFSVQHREPWYKQCRIPCEWTNVASNNSYGGELRIFLPWESAFRKWCDEKYQITSEVTLRENYNDLKKAGKLFSYVVQLSQKHKEYLKFIKNKNKVIVHNSIDTSKDSELFMENMKT